ncbi:MAG: hypothetical protein LBG96_09050 [Tannerella sp.]|jgi:hypothetical protein|nr:hypothetical protein [Tannerella sp.]
MKNKISLIFIISTLLVSINSCSKDKDIIPLYIYNIKIDEYDMDIERNFKAEYKDSQTLECTIEDFFLVKDELKITGIGAYYDGNINMELKTYMPIYDEFKIVPLRISFELTGAGLNRHKCYFFLNLNGDIFELKLN